MFLTASNRPQARSERSTDASGEPTSARRGLVRGTPMASRRCSSGCLRTMSVQSQRSIDVTRRRSAFSRSFSRITARAAIAETRDSPAGTADPWALAPATVSLADGTHRRPPEVDVRGHRELVEPEQLLQNRRLEPALLDDESADRFEHGLGSARRANEHGLRSAAAGIGRQSLVLTAQPFDRRERSASPATRHPERGIDRGQGRGERAHATGLDEGELHRGHEHAALHTPDVWRARGRDGDDTRATMTGRAFGEHADVARPSAVARQPEERER